MAPFAHLIRTVSRRCGLGAALVHVAVLGGARVVGGQEVRVPIARLVAQGQAVTISVEPDRLIRVTVTSADPDHDDRRVVRGHFAPSDVANWVDSARTLLRAADSGRTGLLAPGTSLVLGSKPGVRLELTPSDSGNGYRFDVEECHAKTPGFGIRRDEAAALIDDLARAVDVTRRGPTTAVRPSRPYGASEVSCQAIADTPAVAMPRPSGVDRDRVIDIGIQLTVDSNGLVRAGTIETMPGADRRIANEVRAAASRWRFHPAIRAGVAVAQVLDTVVVLDPLAGWGGDTLTPIVARAEAGGWVHMRMAPRTVVGATGIDEWYRPDQVTDWAARAEVLDRAADAARVAVDSIAARSRAGWGNAPMTTLGGRTNVTLATGYGVPGWHLVKFALSQNCPPRSSWWENVEPPVVVLRAAAESARAVAISQPVESRIYAASEVACPAWVSPWRPRPVMTPRLRTRRAPMQAFVRVVVDRAGDADPESVRVLPANDAELRQAVVATLRRWPFWPARRGGAQVAQTVYVTMAFDPADRDSASESSRKRFTFPEAGPWRGPLFGFGPLVVPVADGPQPYSIQRLARGLADEPPRLATQAPGGYTGSCVSGDVLDVLAEVGQSGLCSSVDVLPWLSLPRGAPSDTRHIVAAAVEYADSSVGLSHYADATHTVRAIVVVVPGHATRPHIVTVWHRSLGASTPTLVQRVVVIGVPRDSTRLAPGALTIAVPYALGLSSDALEEDWGGHSHLTLEAQQAIGLTRFEDIIPGRVLHIDAGIKSCGSMSCYHLYPTFRLTLTPARPGETGADLLYVASRPGEGIFIAVEAGAGGPGAPSRARRFRRYVLLRPGSGDARISVGPEPGGSAVAVTWQGWMATVTVPP